MRAASDAQSSGVLNYAQAVNSEMPQTELPRDEDGVLEGLGHVTNWHFFLP
jgi:hypothetical protein